MNRLEEEWGDEVQVIQVNVNEAEARPILQRLGVLFTPTFVLFDAEGKEYWRSNGALDANEVRQLVSELQNSEPG